MTFVLLCHKEDAKPLGVVNMVKKNFVIRITSPNTLSLLFVSCWDRSRQNVQTCLVLTSDRPYNPRWSISKSWSCILVHALLFLLPLKNNSTSFPLTRRLFPYIIHCSGNGCEMVVASLWEGRLAAGVFCVHARPHSPLYITACECSLRVDALRFSFVVFGIPSSSTRAAATAGLRRLTKVSSDV